MYMEKTCVPTLSRECIFYKFVALGQYFIYLPSAKTVKNIATQVDREIKRICIPFSIVFFGS